jgi:serine phosphatase RsbU (regulator of sigma subunit)
LFPAALWSPRQFRFVWANPAFKRLVGKALEDLDPVGMPKRGFLSDTASASHMQDAAYIGLPYTDAEYEAVGSGGSRSFWQVTYLPLQADFADPFDVLVTAVDVTADVTSRRTAEARRDDALRSIGIVESTLLSSLDGQEILERVLIEATEALDADWGWVVESSEGSWIIRAVHGWPRESLGRPLDDGPGSLPGLAAVSGRVVAESSQDAADALNRAIMQRHDVGAFILVPVKSRGTVNRVIGFCWSFAADIAEAHLEFAERLGVSLSLAMQNAADYAMERGLRRTLQSAFLPVADGLPGIEVGHLCYSATPETTVGGDFYELLRLPDERIGVLIGDAPGHGIEAAALASRMRDALRGEALRSNRPERVVRKADQAVVSTLESGTPFTSLLYGSLEPDTGLFRYCATGQTAPVIKRTREYATSLPHIVVRDGGASYPSSETQLNPGDLLVLYTDGLTLASDTGGEAFGLTRLLEALERYADAETGSIPEHLFQDVFTHCSGRLKDDAAILAIRAA